MVDYKADDAGRKAIERIRADFPDTQAIYIYGSVPHHEETASSDVDVGVLFPHSKARDRGTLVFSDTRVELESIFGREVDLVNLRRVPIVLQKEVIATGVRVFTGDSRAVEEYEMLVLSLYGKLNEERREILEELARTKRAYQV